MTQAQAVAWLTAQIGQHLDYDHAYGQQCFDFFNFYYQALTGDSPYADGFNVSGAKDIWNVPTSRFMKIADSSDLVPQPGDVLIYGASWGLGYGHVEVCLSSDSNGVWVVGENEHGNPSEGVIKVYRTWAQMRGLIGVMRPQLSQGVKMPSEQDIIDQFNKFQGSAPTQDQINYYLQPEHGWADLNGDLLQENYDAKVGLQKQVDALTAANLKMTDQITALKAVPAPAPAKPTKTPASQVTATTATQPAKTGFLALLKRIFIGGSA